jgi:hypothetical protein
MLCGHTRVWPCVVLPLRPATCSQCGSRLNSLEETLRFTARFSAVWSSCSREEGGAVSATVASSEVQSARNAAGAATVEEDRALGTCSGAGTAAVEAGGAVGTSVGSVVLLVAALVLGCERAQARIPPRPEHESSTSPRV